MITLQALCEYYIDCLKSDNVSIVFSPSKDRESYLYIRLDGTGLATDYAMESEKHRSFIKHNFGKELYVGYPCFYDGEKDKVIPLFVFKANLSESAQSLYVDKDSFIMNYGAIQECKLFPEMPVQFIEQLNEINDFAECQAQLVQFASGVKWASNLSGKNLVKEKFVIDSAILFRGDALLSSYSRGLNRELSGLAKNYEQSIHGTALNTLLRNCKCEKKSEVYNNANRIEVLPLNHEQRQAVQQAFYSDFSVITGPPGTGKTQLIAAFAINACYQGKTVLIASKNNKAVDIVEQRINSMGDRPFVMRQGSKEYSNGLSSYLDRLLSYSPTSEDYYELDKLKGANQRISDSIVQKTEQINMIVNLRNELDHEEREICNLRDNKALYDLARNHYDAPVFERKRVEAQSIIDTINIYSSFLKRLKYRIRKKKTQNAYNNLLSRLFALFKELDISSPVIDKPFSPDCIDQYIQLMKLFSARLDNCAKLHGYFTKLGRLISQPQIPSIQSEIKSLEQQQLKNAQQLWRKYLSVHFADNSSTRRQQLMNIRSEIDEAAQQEATRIPFDKLIEFRDCIPCWAVTSLSAYGRIPMIPGFFDYVIIDEASQCDIASALPLLYRAKKAVIVGDPNQLRHITALKPFSNRQLLQQHGINQARFSYLSCSLFDLASTIQTPYMIRDHYRSHPDIIGFSNKFFYNGKLRILTYENALHKPETCPKALEWINVKGKAERPASGSTHNREEAKTVIDILQQIVESGFDGSIGVVSPFRAQANLIQVMISRNKTISDSIIENSIVVDTAHKFQGDEKDVIIFSTVASSGLPDSCLNFLQEQKNVFNVAITRARASLIVVGNQDYCENCSVSFLKEFARYARNQTSNGPTLSNVSPEISSELEIQFGRLLMQAGVTAISQFSACNYSLDFAVIEEDGRKLDIEIDGEMYHKDWNGETIIQDRIRDNILEMNDWTIMRFWSYEVLDCPQLCIRKIKSWIGPTSP